MKVHDQEGRDRHYRFVTASIEEDSLRHRAVWSRAGGSGFGHTAVLTICGKRHTSLTDNGGENCRRCWATKDNVSDNQSFPSARRGGHTGSPLFSLGDQMKRWKR